MPPTVQKSRQQIGERLSQERERLGYTQSQIAQLLGVPVEKYDSFEKGLAEPSISRLPRLFSCGFDILFILTQERHRPIAEENELLDRFRDLSHRGRASIFMTLDSLERLAPNIQQTIRKKLKR